jgi:putative ABC transport system permease protein
MKIKKSLGRFLSLFLIVMVGVGFFAGIQESSPDITSSVSQYLTQQHVMDYRIVSTMGLTDSDVTALKALLPDTTVTPGYELDGLSQGKSIRILGMNEDSNALLLVDGRMPETGTECVADSRHYHIGDTISITNDIQDKMNQTEFTVTGLCESPLFMSNNYGSSTVGNGKLYSFIYVKASVFTLDAYTQINIATTGTDSMDVFTSQYTDKLSSIKDALTSIKSERELARYQEIYNDAKAQITNQLAQLGQFKQLEQQPAYEDQAFAALDNISHPQWSILDRNNVINGYNNLKSGTDTIRILAAILPLFFMLIVALMTSNTMARMIAEERNELGTLVSLGYSNRQIISTYLLYVLSATLLGTFVGFFAGSTIIPKIIYSCFPYTLPPLTLQHGITTLVLITTASVVLMSIVTIVFSHTELNQQPASLMRPIPPKHGQKLFLEKIGFIWKHLSFTWKVTLRNLFRYKQRGFMTIVGIAGCTALLLTGFGIRDSMNGVAEKQYQEVFTYNTMMVLNDETSVMSEDLNTLLTQQDIQSSALLHQSSLTCEAQSTSLDAYLVVPADEASFNNYFHLLDASNNTDLTLNDDGVIISKKLSETFHVKAGDTLTVKDSAGRDYTLLVSGITQNYVQNYIYMNSTMYNSVFPKAVTYNMIVTSYTGDQSALAQALIDSGKIANVSFTGDILQQITEQSNSINSVIVLLVCISSLLEIIVLYNLTSINISERRREIATLKVLGFYDNETNAYIYREAFLLTFLSILIGLLLGIEMHLLVMGMIKQDNMEYFKVIKPLSFLWTFLITLSFSIIMQAVTHFNLKKIDMIESLKSVE